MYGMFLLREHMMHMAHIIDKNSLNFMSESFMDWVLSQEYLEYLIVDRLQQTL